MLTLSDCGSVQLVQRFLSIFVVIGWSFAVGGHGHSAKNYPELMKRHFSPRDDVVGNLDAANIVAQQIAIAGKSSPQFAITSLKSAMPCIDIGAVVAQPARSFSTSLEIF